MGLLNDLIPQFNFGGVRALGNVVNPHAEVIKTLSYLLMDSDSGTGHSVAYARSSTRVRFDCEISGVGTLSED